MRNIVSSDVLALRSFTDNVERGNPSSDLHDSSPNYTQEPGASGSSVTSDSSRRYQFLLVLAAFTMIFHIIGINSIYGLFQVRSVHNDTHTSPLSRWPLYRNFILPLTQILKMPKARTPWCPSLAHSEAGSPGAVASSSTLLLAAMTTSSSSLSRRRAHNEHCHRPRQLLFSGMSTDPFCPISSEALTPRLGSFGSSSSRRASCTALERACTTFPSCP